MVLATRLFLVFLKIRRRARKVFCSEQNLKKLMISA